VCVCVCVCVCVHIVSTGELQADLSRALEALQVFARLEKGLDPFQTPFPSTNFECVLVYNATPRFRQQSLKTLLAPPGHLGGMQAWERCRHRGKVQASASAGLLNSIHTHARRSVCANVWAGVAGRPLRACAHLPTGGSSTPMPLHSLR